MSDLCQTCVNYQFCSVLCPEAELSLKEEETAQRELPIGLPHYGRFPVLPSNTFLTTTEKQITLLIGQGLNRKQVCNALEISRQSLRVHLLRMRRKV